MTGTMSPRCEIWPTKFRSSRSPKWMLSSRPRVGRSPLAMYWRSTSSGVAPFTSIEPRLRISGERMSSRLERVGRADGAGLLAQRAEQPADDLGLPVQVDQPLLERPGQAHPIVELEKLVPRQPGPGGRIGGESAGDGHADPGWRRRDPGVENPLPRGESQASVGRKRGAFRCIVICSNAYASRSSVGSLHARPMNERLTGRPHAWPIGTLMLG